MGMLRDLIERRHTDQRDQMFRQYDTYKGILMDPRGVEAGGFSDEQKKDALDRMVDMASPSKQHASAVKPVFQHLLGLAGKVALGGGGGGGGSQAPRQPMGPPEARAPMGPPQAPVGPGALAVNADGSPNAGAVAPTTTGSVSGDTTAAAAPAAPTGDDAGAFVPQSGPAAMPTAQPQYQPV